MIRILFLFILALLPPNPAPAEEACDAILALAQTQQALERVSAPGHRRVSADMEFVRRTLLRVDAANVNYALRDHPLASQTAAIEDFLELARTVSDEYHSGRRNPALNYLLSEDPRLINRNIGMMLRGYPCLQSAERQLSGLQQLRSNNVEQIAVGQFTRTRIITSLVISVAMIPVFVGLIFFQARRIQLKNRLEKRYYLELPAKLVASREATDLSQTNLWMPITIEDLSCSGAKISPGTAVPTSPSAAVTLLIDANQHAATVKWSNPHYAGVKFETPLSFSHVKRLVNAHPPTGEIGSPSAHPDSAVVRP